MGASVAAPSSHRCCQLIPLRIVPLLGDSLRCARGAVDTGGLIQAEFPKVFLFGMATLGFQVEGMATGGGREPSIEDPFVPTAGTHHIIHEVHELIELDPTYCCYQSTQIAGVWVPADNRVSKSLQIY
jgi:hypothetical protein